TVFGPLALLPGGQRHALMGVRLFRRAQSVLSVVYRLSFAISLFAAGHLAAALSRFPFSGILSLYVYRS
ncbi:MAG: hypothetical protein LBT33_04025, partial [Spirochaetia bacterium]|nr:hypothetical protein [Spirochaetia bacterium]